MAIEVENPVDLKPKQVFTGLYPVFNALNADRTAFDYHMHVPVFGQHRAEAAELRLRLLDMPSDDLKVSQIWEPRGPHIKYPYFSAYFPGTLLNEVVDVVDQNRGDASVMIHPITGLQFAEHSCFARWYGPKIPEALDWDMLKGIDKKAGLVYPGL